MDKTKTKIQFGRFTYDIARLVMLRGEAWLAITGPRGGEYFAIHKGTKWLVCDSRSLKTINQYDESNVRVY